MLELVVIADDLTGAADTSVQFCPFLKRVWLFPGEILPTVKQSFGPTAWGVHTDSRALSPSQAYLKTKKLTSTLLEINPGLIYKKIDSCMRGNVGIEVQALLEVLGSPCAFIAPAYPEMGRVTLNGLHLVHGVPVAQSEMGRDPLSPVGSSRLEELIGGPYKIPVAHMDLRCLESPEELFRTRVEDLVSKGVRHISFDALETSHLKRIAHAALKMGALPVGSAGLAEALAQVHFKAAGVSPHRLSIRRLKRQLFVVGSKSEKAQAQTNFLLRIPFVRHLTVPLKRPGKNQEPSKQISYLDSGCLVLTPEPPQGSGADPRKITQALATAASEIVQSWRPQGIFLTGGDTARAVLERLGIERIRLLGELYRGVVIGKAQGGMTPGLLVLTKAGAFGDEQAMARVFQVLRGDIRPKEQGKGDSK